MLFRFVLFAKFRSFVNELIAVGLPTTFVQSTFPEKDVELTVVVPILIVAVAGRLMLVVLTVTRVFNEFAIKNPAEF